MKSYFWEYFSILYFPPLLFPSLYSFLLLSLASSLTLILNLPLTKVHSKWLQSVYKYHYSFLNFTIAFHYFFRKIQFYLWLKEISKAGRCFLVSCTTVSGTHRYAMNMFIQLNSILCITNMSMYMYIYIIIFIWAV